MASQPDPRSVQPQLRRVLGLPQVTAGGVGIIIGAGIYVLIGAATAEAGAGVWMSFLIAALLSALTAMSYMELTAMFPSAGGEYEYTRHALPEWFAFLIGWVMVAGLVVGAAAISLGFASYLNYFIDIDVRIAAFGLLALVCLIASTGIKESTGLTMVLSAVQVGGLLFVIAIGASHVGERDLLEVTSFQGVFGAAALVFFAFIGFDEVISLAEETENPTRNVPRALALSLGISTLLYLGVAITAVSAIGAEALAASERPLADVIDQAVGGSGGDVMAALAVISTTNTTLLVVTASSRVLYSIARRGALPAALSSVDVEHRTPIVALVVTVALAAGFVMLRDMALIASVTDFAVYVVFLVVNLTLVILRLKLPDQPRVFRVPGSIGRIPVIPVIALVTVLGLMTQLDLEAIGLGVCLIVAGIVIPPLLRIFWRGSEQPG